MKETIAKNIAKLRKSRNMTQSALAEKLNYSDKAISRWEHAETLPDIDTLCKLCEIFGVTFEYLLDKDAPAPTPSKAQSKAKAREVIICLIAIMTVWLTVTVLYTSFNALARISLWQLFIWAVPASALVGLIFNLVWWRSKVWSAILSSFFNWSTILAVFVQFIEYNLWMLFIVGVPIQAIILLSITMPRLKKGE